MFRGPVIESRNPEFLLVNWILHHVDVEARILDVLEEFEVPVDGVFGPVVKRLVQHVREHVQSMGVIGEPEFADLRLVILIVALVTIVQSDQVVQGDDRWFTRNEQHGSLDIRHVLALKSD